MAALGRSGVGVKEAKTDLYLGDMMVVRAGAPLPFNKRGVIKLLGGKEVVVRLRLNLGPASATAWGCDLSEEYVTINSRYMT
jgi:glutamate N-acetyltransferase/amino-acid N-acetyltransferase